MKPYGPSDKGWCCEYEDGPVNTKKRKQTAGKAAKHRNRRAAKEDIKKQIKDDKKE